MRKTTTSPAKKLKIAMILRDLRAMDLARHIGISHSLIDKLMTGRIAEVSPDMARRINRFFGKRIFPVRAVKKAKKSRITPLSGEGISANTPHEAGPHGASYSMQLESENQPAPANAVEGPQAACPLCQSARATMLLTQIAGGKMRKTSICEACFSENGSPDISSVEFSALFDSAYSQANKGGRNP